MFLKKAVVTCGVIGLLCMALVPKASAEITKEIFITSSPAGAEVSQLEGSKKIAIGKTPIKHKSTFHSDQSLLRFEITSPGFEKEIIKVTADEEKKHVVMEKSSDVANDEEIKDKTAKELQKKSEETIKAVLSNYRSKSGLPSLRFYEKIRFVKQSNGYYLKVPVALGDVAPSSKLAESTWSALYAPFIYPLSKALNNRLGPTQIQINAISSQEDIDFSPQTRVETSVVMVCVAGMKTQYVYDACASYSSGKCRGGTVRQRVWDPCASEKPVTVTNTVIDVNASPGQDRGSILFELNTKDVLEINNPVKLYQVIKTKVVSN